jgi:hypothetical protein
MSSIMPRRTQCGNQMPNSMSEQMSDKMSEQMSEQTASKVSLRLQGSDAYCIGCVFVIVRSEGLALAGFPG